MICERVDSTSNNRSHPFDLSGRGLLEHYKGEHEGGGLDPAQVAVAHATEARIRAVSTRK